MRLEGAYKKGARVPLTVSIPYWCDWKEEMKVKLGGESPFQFLIGAIGSGWLSGVSPTSILFQFLIGAIGSSAES